MAAVGSRLWPALIGLTLAACVTAGPSPTLPPATQTAVPSTPTASPIPATVTLAPSATDAPATPAPPATPSVAPATGTATVTPSATVPPIVHFMAVGDLMLGRSVGDHMQSQGAASVFSGVASTLLQADLLAGNLECVVSDQGQPQFKSFTFQAPPLAVEALSSVGFDVLSLANNHSMDYGLDGLADMLARLREAGLNTVGAGADAEAAEAPVILERNGVHVAFLAYVNVPVESRTTFDTHAWAAAVEKPGVAWGDPAVIAKDVAEAKTLADVVVVLLHSGLESSLAVDSIQRTLAHAAVDAGAALVIGAHSHTLQPVEHYKDGIIAYSLGNFVFDGFTTPSNYSAIFTATLTPTGVDSYDWIPVVIEKGLPRLATPAEAAEILPLVRVQ